MAQLKPSGAGILAVTTRDLRLVNVVAPRNCIDSGVLHNRDRIGAVGTNVYHVCDTIPLVQDAFIATAPTELIREDELFPAVGTEAGRERLEL